MAHGSHSITNVPGERVMRIRGLGANGSALTLQEGTLLGITSARSGEGAYTFTFASNPGTLVGWYVGFGAATPADLKGYTAVRDTFDFSSSADFTFVVYDSSFAAADIIANQYIDITLVFKETGVTS